MAAGAAAACGGGLLSGACLGFMLSDGDAGSLCKGGADKRTFCAGCDLVLQQKVD